MSAYTEAILNFRRQKDEYFASGRGPVQEQALDDFTGLSYFAPDENWASQLPLEPFEADALRAVTEQNAQSPQEFVLETNTGLPRFMTRLGYVTVTFAHTERRLSVFAPLGEEKPARAFIPFKDATSGKQTYGAGRYLDAPLTETENGRMIEVDFNLAYHPYCAYASSWTCPLPPAENVLAEEILAGERLP